jgi:hypothetical protein
MYKSSHPISRADVVLAKCMMLFSLSRERTQRWTRGTQIIDVHSYSRYTWQFLLLFRKEEENL